MQPHQVGFDRLDIVENVLGRHLRALQRRYGFGKIIGN